MESSGNLGGAPFQLPGRPYGRGGGRAGSGCPAPGHLGGISPSSPPRPVLSPVTLPAPPATLKSLERGQGALAGAGRGGPSRGRGGGRRAEAARRRERRNGVRGRGGEWGGKGEPREALPRSSDGPPGTRPCAREPRAGGSGGGGGGPGDAAGGCPAPPACRPPCGWNVPEARVSRTREPEAAGAAAPPAGLFTQPYLRAIGPGMCPGGAPGSCGFVITGAGPGRPPEGRASARARPPERICVGPGTGRPRPFAHLRGGAGAPDRDLGC